LLDASLTRSPASGKGKGSEHRMQKSALEMSDSQLTSIARLSERLIALKERL
jgi:hypothetical protein